MTRVLNANRGVLLQARLALCCTLFGPAALLAQQPASQEPAKAPGREPIYDTKADGEQQIAAVLATAKRDNKRVLLQFGANWCGWCHKLHHLFKTDEKIARTLQYEYELVLIDVDTVDGRKHNEAVDAKYGNPTQHGLPVLVVLDAEGKQLVTQETGALEEGDHHNPAAVLAFLEKHKPQPQVARDVLQAALARAASESKNVFVHFSAPWCGWCRKLDAYLQRTDVAAAFGAAFVPVKIDVDRMTGGKELDRQYRGSDEGGIPFFVILDGTGKKLADSNGPKGNVGFPAESFEIEHYMKVVRETAPKLTAAQLAVLEKGLKPGA